jgi:hypothetical protein
MKTSIKPMNIITVMFKAINIIEFLAAIVKIEQFWLQLTTKAN